MITTITTRIVRMSKNEAYAVIDRLTVPSGMTSLRVIEARTADIQYLDDALIASRAEILDRIARPAGIKIIAAIPSPVSSFLPYATGERCK